MVRNLNKFVLLVSSSLSEMSTFVFNFVCFEGWTGGAGASTGGDGWNTGGLSTERFCFSF